MSIITDLVKKEDEKYAQAIEFLEYSKHQFNSEILYDCKEYLLNLEE